MRADFIAFNSQARRSAKAQGRTPQPAIIVSKAHGVLHVATSDGSINLWAAPKKGGGTCSYVVWDPERNDGGLTSCLPRGESFPHGVDWIRQAADQGHPSQVIHGYTARAATTILVRLANGSSKTLPVVERYFLGAFPADAKIISLAARDDHGRVLGSSRVR